MKEENIKDTKQLSESYKFILDCIEKYETYINNFKPKKRKITELKGDLGNIVLNNENHHISISIEDLRKQVTQQHFSWMVFMYVVTNSGLEISYENIKELINSLLPNLSISMGVTIKSKYGLVNKSAILSQNYSLRFIVLNTIIRHTDISDINLFKLLMEGLQDFELARLANSFNLPDEIFKLLITTLGLSSLTDEEIEDELSRLTDETVTSSLYYEDVNEEVDDLANIISSIYSLWFDWSGPL